MVIQWKSGAALEALSRLRRAERGLEDCLRQAQTVRTSLQEANPDGENQTLKKALELFESCEKKLRQLRDDVENCQAGVRRADARFAETERSIVRLAEGLGAARAAPVAGSADGYVRWEPAAYATISGMRVDVAPMPAWLKDAAMEERAGRP